MRVFLRPLLYLLCSLFLITAGLSAQTPVANYSFSGNANDQATMGTNAAVHGALLAQDRFGWANNAFSFDGQQDYLQAANSAALNSDYTTVAFWLKIKELPVAGEVYPLSFGGWQERWKISLPPHGKLVWTTNNSSGISDMDAGAGNELVAGIWKHVVFIHNGTKDLIYFDGVQVAEKNVTGTMSSTSYPLGIGYNPIDGGNFFNGILDEIRIYNVALSAGQVQTLFTSQSTPPSIPNGLVASYSFSNNTTDKSSFANHGKATDLKPVTDRFGFGNSAFSFNGTSSTFTANNSTPLNSGNTTVSFWVKPNSLPASGEVFLMSFGGWQERWKISLPSHGKAVWTTNNSSGISDLDAGGGNELVAGEWKQLVMVHNGTKDIIYLNGVNVAEKNVAGTLNSTSSPLGIGYNAVDGGGYFDGVFDEVQIYNYALSPSDIATAYANQSAFPGTPGTLVAQYNFAGDTDDTSPFQNHGLGNGTMAAVDRFGYPSNAHHFSGTKGILAANSVALNSDFATISFWVNVEELPASGEVYLLSNGGWQERWKISMPSHGKPVFTTHSNGACCSDLDSGTPLSIGVWTHVVMIHDGAKDLIYFNGAKVNEKAVAGTLDPTNHPFGIAYDPIDNGSFFKGQMDEVQIYNVAFTNQQVMDLYTAQNTAVSIPGDLVASYPFSGNANDATLYKNNAQGIGAQLVNDRFGGSNKAYAFNGIGDGIKAANPPQLNSDFATISFWVNVKELPASGEAYLLSNGGWQERWKISVPSHGKPVFTTHSNGACCSDLDSGTPLNIGVWTHIAMVHDGAKDLIYFDGVKVNEKATVGTLDPTTHPFGIGYDPIDNANFFKGSIDEVQIYKVALSAGEIAAIYAAQSTPPVATDVETPSSPLNLSAEVTFNNVNLSWLASTDNIGVTGYNVFQDGSKILTTKNTTAEILALTPLTTFEFSLTAVDEAGNESLPSSLMVTSGPDQTPDTESPTAPGNLAAATGAHSVLLSWEPSTDNVKVAGYVTSVDGIFADSLGGNATSVFIGGLDAQTLYTFEAYAFDLAGNNSALAEITVSTDAEIDTGEPGLVAWYPFNGNANDATPYLNHGVIGGNPVFEAVTHPNGTGNQAIVFDGVQDSVLASNAVQLISDYTTISFWIRVDEVPTDAEAYIIDFGHWSERSKISLPQHLRIVWTTNSKNGISDNFIHDMDSGDGNDLVVGFWWYVTMVHDGTNDIIYLDGVEVNSLPADGTLNSTSFPLGMGNNPIEGGQYFKGALDEVKIYNRALTAGEVARLYADGTLVGLDENLDNGISSVVQSVFPNPVMEQLVIEHSFNNQEALLLRVFDVQGRQVDVLMFDKNELPAKQFTIDVAAYATGTYFLNFVVGGKNLGSVKFDKE